MRLGYERKNFNYWGNILFEQSSKLTLKSSYSVLIYKGERTWEFFGVTSNIHRRLEKKVDFVFKILFPVLPRFGMLILKKKNRKLLLDQSTLENIEPRFRSRIYFYKTGRRKPFLEELNYLIEKIPVAY